jgi:hypothetical protein
LTHTIIRYLSGKCRLTTGQIRRVAGRVAGGGVIAFAGTPSVGIVGMPCGGGVALKIAMVFVDIVDGCSGGSGNVGIGNGRWCDVVTRDDGDDKGGDEYGERCCELHCNDDNIVAGVSKLMVD